MGANVYLGNSMRHVSLAMLCRCSLETSSEEIVRQIKEVCCRVAAPEWRGRVSYAGLSLA